jgi:hypothetical protein
MENNMTAVEWLESKLTEYLQRMYKSEIEQAKEMEKQQIIDCSIETSQDCYKAVMAYMGQDIVFNEEDLINQRKEAEQYYNEKYNKNEK